METALFATPGREPIRSSKPWERLSMDIVGPKPMTRNKNQYFLTVGMSLVGFPSPSLSGTSRLVASSSVFQHFSPSSEHLGSFTLTGAHTSSHRNSKTSAAKMELQPPKLRPTTLGAMAKTSATTELCGKPFSACYTPQTAH